MEIIKLRSILLEHCADSKEVSAEDLKAVNELLVSKEFFKYLHSARDKKK
ncbi:MAG: hypothetical protein ACK5ML_01145 [Lachnospiraceae bacterium]